MSVRIISILSERSFGFVDLVSLEQKEKEKLAINHEP